MLIPHRGWSGRSDAKQSDTESVCGGGGGCRLGIVGGVHYSFTELQIFVENK